MNERRLSHALIAASYILSLAMLGFAAWLAVWDDNYTAGLFWLVWSFGVRWIAEMEKSK